MLIPPIQVTIDKPRLLKCTMASLAKIKEWTGHDLIHEPQSIIGDLVRDAEGTVTGARIDPIRFDAVLAAFLYNTPGVSPAEAGALIEDLDTMSRVGTAIAEAWVAFIGAKKEPADPLAPAAGTN